MPRKKTPRISEEERAEVNRRNGRMSKGPVTEAGKIRASRNALKTGCQATVHHLDSEDPALIRARYALWELYYQPESPAAHHLLNENVRATLRLDRCEAATQSLVNTQLADASTDWRRAREQDIKDLSCVLAFDPALHLRELKASSMGCDWLVSRWGFLGGRVETAEAFLLLGWFPETGGQRWDPIRFLADAGYTYGELEVLYRVEAKSAFHASLKELEKTLEKDKERADDGRDRLEELQRSTGFFVGPAADVAAAAWEGPAEGTLGSLPEGPGAAGADVPNGTSTGVKICGTQTPAGTLGSRGSDSRNEPNVPGRVGPGRAAGADAAVPSRP
jgi:hypothetical protein